MSRKYSDDYDYYDYVDNMELTCYLCHLRGRAVWFNEPSFNRDSLETHIRQTHTIDEILKLAVKAHWDIMKK